MTGVLVATQISVVVWLTSRGWRLPYRIALFMSGPGIVGAVMILPGLPARSIELAMTGSFHAIAYASLLTWFATSLGQDREPVVTALARRIRSTMPEKVVRYTRQVTIAWCVFFAAQLAVSAVLVLVAPEAIWVAFVNFLNLPLLVVMILAEFGYRRVLFRHEARTSLIETLSAMRHARFTPANRP
jgi:uncharacterized membrane protein